MQSNNHELQFDELFSSFIKTYRGFDAETLGAIRRITPEFNLCRILDLGELEISRIIGELLNPAGRHEQGRVFLDQFIDRFLPKRIGKELRSASRIGIKLEEPVKAKDGRIDVYLEFDDRFGIAIENKPFCEDLPEQLQYYCADLSVRFPKENFVMVYLSGNGNDPDESSISKKERRRLGDRFVVLPYRLLKDWVIECADISEKVGAKRLSEMIREFSEFITMSFLGENTMRKSFLDVSIKKNVLEANEIANLWEKNSSYRALWAEEVNRRFNIDLPNLVLGRLKESGKVGADWAWERGDFDIRKRHVAGPNMINASWKRFRIGIYSSANRPDQEWSRYIFLAIKCRNAPDGYLEGFFNQFNKKYLAIFGNGIKPTDRWPKKKLVWSCCFPDTDYKRWGYAQWAEIKEGGKTVEYVAEFLGKLIAVCGPDIEKEEERLSV